jgi:SpoVK/Ycf46/Vps4 family AAA+-type ATPase
MQLYDVAIRVEQDAKASEQIKIKYVEVQTRVETLLQYLKTQEPITNNNATTTDEPVVQEGRKRIKISDAKHTDDEAHLLKNKPNVLWKDIVGLDRARNELLLATWLPQHALQLYDGARKPVPAILLYGYFHMYLPFLFFFALF